MQQGSVIREHRKLGPDVWCFRSWEAGPNGIRGWLASVDDSRPITIGRKRGAYSTVRRFQRLNWAMGTRMLADALKLGSDKREAPANIRSHHFIASRRSHHPIG